MPGEMEQVAGLPGTSGRVSHGFVVITTIRNFWHLRVHGVQHEAAVVVVLDDGGYSKEAVQQDIMQMGLAGLMGFPLLLRVRAINALQ
jgi:hypothetical protein